MKVATPWKLYTFAVLGLLAACNGGSNNREIANGESALTPSCSSVEGARLSSMPTAVPAICEADSWYAGSTEICKGRHIYRDYVYDDYGADSGRFLADISAPAGDQSYPEGNENTADLVNLQLWEEGGRLHIRGELNTLYQADSTILALAIDTDDNILTGGGDWCDIEVASDGWEVLQAFRKGDPDSNIIEGSIPMPSGRQWSVQAVVAQSDGTVMNVAYRGVDEQAGCAQGTTGKGCFFEDKQAAALRSADISAFGARITVSDLRKRVSQSVADIAPGLHSRVYTSKYTLPPGEGVGDIEGRGDGGQIPLAAQNFVYFGKYQPYGIYIPESGGAPYPLQMVFHGTGAVHSSQINQSGMQEAFGEQFGRILVAPLARGPDGYGSDISERDILDVMDDVESNFDIDRERVIASGYSQGGYVTYRMASLYPHRFAGFITWVGFTGNGFNGFPEFTGLTATAGAVGNIRDFIGNLRNMPGSMIVAALDELVHVNTTIAMQQAFEASDNIYKWYMHPIAEHLIFMLLDNWDKEAADSENWIREKNPVRVSFRYDPTIGNPEFGIAHDQAYWISEIKNREVGDDHLDQIYGDIDLTNHACGGNVPTTRSAVNAGGLPLPWVSVERNQSGKQPITKDALIEGTLNNIAELTIDAEKTCSENRALRYDIDTDGPVEIKMTDGRSVQLLSAGQYMGQF